MNDAILHAIFGDGCAVAVVGGRTARSAEPGSLAVLDNRSWLVSLCSASVHLFSFVCGLFFILFFTNRCVCVLLAEPFSELDRGSGHLRAIISLQPFCFEVKFGGTRALKGRRLAKIKCVRDSKVSPVVLCKLSPRKLLRAVGIVVV